jgi:hypothetical protein
MSSDYDTDWHEDLNRIRRALDTTSEERMLAKVSINCFRQGSPPKNGVSKLTVGLRDAQTIFQRELQRARDGACSFTLVNGNYGAGKSHCLYLLREIALAQNFAVSFLSLSQRECPLYDLSVVYSQVVHRIEGKKAFGVITLQDILELWAEGVRQKGQNSLEAAICEIKALHPDFQKALAEYLCPTFPGAAELVERWLVGDDSTKRTASRLKIEMRPTNEQALEMMQQLGKLGRSIGFNGLVVLLDEAEGIPSYDGPSRQKLCYDNLCRLLERENRVPHCYFVYATTPIFFQKSYGHIGISEQSHEVLNLRPLLRIEYIALGRIIRDLYRIGEGWKGCNSSFNDRQIDRCVEWYMRSHSGDAKPRNFVRSLVSALDICAQNPKRKLSNVFMSEQEVG